MTEDLPPMLLRVKQAGIDPKELKEKTAAVFGVGGLGSLVAEMLVRVGIGKVILIDMDVVGPENFNRLGFEVEDIGKPKVEAVAKKLRRIADVRGESFKLEVETHRTDVLGWEGIKDVIGKADVVLTCFDNVEARLQVNYWAVRLRKPLVDGATSENGLRGRVVVVIPGKTPCLHCYFSGGSVLMTDISTDAPCNASIPTTMAIVASLQVDQGLKLLLNKEGVADRISVDLTSMPFVRAITGLKRRRNCPVCGELNG